MTFSFDWLKIFSFPKRLSLKWKQSGWCNEVYLKASSYFGMRFWRTSKITTLKTGDFYYNILTIILQKDFILQSVSSMCNLLYVLYVRINSNFYYFNYATGQMNIISKDTDLWKIQNTEQMSKLSYNTGYNSFKEIYFVENE